MKYFSMFSGIGGFELGIQQAYENLRPLQSDNPKRPKERNDTKDKSLKWKCGYDKCNPGHYSEL